MTKIWESKNKEFFHKESVSNLEEYISSLKALKEEFSQKPAEISPINFRKLAHERTDALVFPWIILIF